MLYGFSIIATGRTYQIELRERSYANDGKCNAYLAVYGQLSGDYMGCIEEPIKFEITENEVPELLLDAEDFVFRHKHCRVSIW